MAWIPIQEQLIQNLTEPASAFSLSQTPRDESLLLFINGVGQTLDVHYTISGADLFTTSVIPSGWNVFAAYSYYDNVSPGSNTIDSCEDYERAVPAGRAGSTTLNHAITSYELLAERIKMQLGYPAIRIELCDDQIYDFIDQGIEWYSKYAGYTEEYLVFNACSLYKCGLGIKLDDLFTQYYQYQCCSEVSHAAQISAQFVDCDLNAYRKVVDVFSVEPVEFTGTDTLFTMDYMFAQQTYFSYMLGSFGFDLVTWHILKDWLNLREKLFATKPYVRFDPRTQYLKLTPEPTGNKSFLGVIGCRVERSIADMVRERWVQRYALALTMIALGHVRGKFGQVTLFGGGSLNASDIMTQGLEMKKGLEEEIMGKYGEVEPPYFFIG